MKKLKTRLTVLAAGVALAATALAQTGPIAVDIPPQPLHQALNALARQTGAQILFVSDITTGKTAPAVTGNMTVREALSQLLQGSSLQVRAIDERSFSVVQEGDAGGENVLPQVDVTAPATTDLPPVYAGGQVARGGNLGMLGNMDVMDTPFSITNYTSELIQNQQADAIQDVLLNEPSIRSSSGAGGHLSYFSIRGFFVGTREVKVDGLQGMAPQYGDLSAAFAERVEVLKGPSALLYGMSPGGSVGGSINLVPKRAGDTPLTRLTLGVESDAVWKAHVDTGKRFGTNNQWGLRFNGTYNNGDGYLDGQKKEGHLGALALDYRGEQLRLSLDAYRTKSQISGSGPLTASVSNSSTAPSWLSSMPKAPDARTNMLPGSPGSKEVTQAVMLGGEYAFNTSWTGYAKLGVQDTEVQGLWAGNVSNVQANGDGLISPYACSEERKTKSAEAGLRGRFQTGSVSHALVLSASHLDRDTNSRCVRVTAQPTNIYNPASIIVWPISPTQVPRTSDATLSGLALADTLGFMNDRVLLTLGVRRQNVKTTNFDANTGAVSSGYDASAWTPMAGLVIKPSDDLSLYANYIQGLSQGTTVGNTYQNAGEVFPPYKTEQIELGAKLQTGRFTNTFSVYEVTRPSTLTDNSTTPLPTLRLNGEQRNRGVEWTIFGEMTRGLRVLGGVAYTQRLLTKTQNGLQDGNHVSGSSPWTANLGIDWDVTGLLGLALNGRVIYTGRQYIDNANSLELPSWTRLDLGARYAIRLGNKPVIFRANIDNVFDRSYWQGNNESGTANLGMPRIFRLSASIDF